MPHTDLKSMQSESTAQGMTRIPLCVPELAGNEWLYVKECLDTNWVSSVGPFVNRFEEMLARYIGAKHAVATVNGTAALHVALLVAGVEPDDEVMVSSLTFIAPANAIRYALAWPVFIDAEPNHLQMDPEQVDRFIRRECRWQHGALVNRSTGRRVRAVLPVHILGHPVDMDPIRELAAKYELVVVEDASESLGATYKGTMVGKLGRISCFSFNGNKIITTGGGGMIVTDDDRWADRARYLTTQAKDDPIEYVHNHVGFNYRLSNVLAAIGCAQMENLDGFVNAKRNIAGIYERGLESIAGIRPVGEAPWARSTFWMTTIQVDEPTFGIDSRELMRRLGARGIETRPLWQPIHRSEAHANVPARTCPVADDLYRTSLSLPSSVGVTEEQIRQVIGAVASSPPETSHSNARPKR